MFFTKYFRRSKRRTGIREWEEKGRRTLENWLNEIPKDLRELEIALEDAKKRGLNFDGSDYSGGKDSELKKVVSRIHNSARGALNNISAVVNLSSILKAWGRLDKEYYDKVAESLYREHERVVGLFRESIDVLGKDIHAQYQRERLASLIALSGKYIPKTSRRAA